jgi:uncharacterized protein with von Willebrand factor type A (vWA) domain
MIGSNKTDERLKRIGFNVNEPIDFIKTATEAKSVLRPDKYKAIFITDKVEELVYEIDRLPDREHKKKAREKLVHEVCMNAGKHSYDISDNELLGILNLIKCLCFPELHK